MKEQKSANKSRIEDEFMGKSLLKDDVQDFFTPRKSMTVKEERFQVALVIDG